MVELKVSEKLRPSPIFTLIDDSVEHASAVRFQEVTDETSSIAVKKAV
jgi:hypothetical protein